MCVDVKQVIAQNCVKCSDGIRTTKEKYRLQRELLFLRFYLFILERGEGREKERERNIDVPERH